MFKKGEIVQLVSGMVVEFVVDLGEKDSDGGDVVVMYEGAYQLIEREMIKGEDKEVSLSQKLEDLKAMFGPKQKAMPKVSDKIEELVKTMNEQGDEVLLRAMIDIVEGNDNPLISYLEQFTEEELMEATATKAQRG